MVGVVVGVYKQVECHSLLCRVKDLPKEILTNSWTSGSSKISERTRQQGLQYAFEKYIHNITCHRNNDNEKEIKIEAKAHRSQCKTQTIPTSLCRSLNLTLILTLTSRKPYKDTRLFVQSRVSQYIVVF